jgi:hypothetical protein
VRGPRIEQRLFELGHPLRMSFGPRAGFAFLLQLPFERLVIDTKHLQFGAQPLCIDGREIQALLRAEQFGRLSGQRLLHGQRHAAAHPCECHGRADQHPEQKDEERADGGRTEGLLRHGVA